MFWAARALHWRMQRAYNLGRKVWVISKFRRDGDRLLQLLIFNEECLVSASHQLALITSLPFVHTARRYYRLNGLVSSLDCCTPLETSVSIREGDQTWSFRGSKSRNKVSVGEPAEGSLLVFMVFAYYRTQLCQARARALCLMWKRRRAQAWWPFLLVN